MRWNKILSGLFSLLFILFLTSCGGGGGGGTSSKVSFGGGNTGNGNTTNPTDNNPDTNTDNDTNPDIGNSSKDTFLALYIVGSDLESDGDAGTVDLLELIDGYNQLTDEEKKNIYVYVAFGGANKEGWRGVKYANIDCIIQDGKDKKFGNDNCYEYSQEITTLNAKNMSHPEAFNNFIKKIKTLSSGFKTKVLVLWNHGAAYNGYGIDENWQKDGVTIDSKKDGLSNNDTLTIYEIRDVFKKADVKFDIIGFDACLMANLEVASAIKDFGTYLVASEEIEPGHGWFYTDVIQIFAKNPDKSVLEKAKLLVDSFVNYKDHDQGSGLTLSVIDLTKINDILTSLDKINFNNLDLKKIVLAEKTSQKYGYFMDGNTFEEFYYTIDLYQFADKAGLTEIRDKIKEVVQYKKDDGSIISSGISMASFSKIIEFIENGDMNLKNNNILPSNYFAKLEALHNQIKSDKKEPQISAQNCTNDEGTQGVCFTITDGETAVESVGVYVLIPSNYGYYSLALYDYLPQTGNNQYFFNKAEFYGVLVFCNGRCSNSSQQVFAPLFYLYQTPKNEIVYIVPAIAEQKAKGYVVLKYNPVDNSMYLYFAITPTSKRQYIIGQDIQTLQFIHFIVDTQGNITKQVSQPFDFSNGIDITPVSLGGTGITPIMILEATDVAGNSSSYVLP